MTFNTSTRRALLSSGALLATGALPAGAQHETNTSSAQSDEPAEQETEPMDAVQFVHLAPDVGTVDVYADSTLGFDDVSLFQETKYISYSPKTYSAAVTPTGESRESYLLETDVTFESGAYTLALVGEHCATTQRPLSLVTLRDDYSPIEDGHARVGFVHASPDAPALDLRTDDGEMVAEDVAFSEGKYAEVPAGGSEQVYALHETGVDDPLARFELGFEAGTVYSAFAVGYLNPDEAPDEAQAAQLQIGMFEHTETTEG